MIKTEGRFICCAILFAVVFNFFIVFSCKITKNKNFVNMYCIGLLYLISFLVGK